MISVIIISTVIITITFAITIIIVIIHIVSNYKIVEGPFIPEPLPLLKISLRIYMGSLMGNMEIHRIQMGILGNNGNAHKAPVILYGQSIRYMDMHICLAHLAAKSIKHMEICHISLCTSWKCPYSVPFMEMHMENYMECTLYIRDTSCAYGYVHVVFILKSMRDIKMFMHIVQMYPHILYFLGHLKLIGTFPECIKCMM